MRITYLCALVGVLLFICGCSGNSEDKKFPVTVTVDLDDVHEIEFEKGKLVSLETSDSSLIFDIANMAVYEDEVVINSRSLLKRFDKNTGRFLGNISRMGEGPGEYLGIQHMWNEGDTVNIIDFNAGVVHSYNKNGEYLGKKVNFRDIKADNFYTPMFMIPRPDADGYCIINCYNGGLDYNPQFSYLTEGMEFDAHVPERELHDGGYTPDRMFADYDNKRLLTWEQLRDTLFTVDTEGVHPLYVFDFGKYKFPIEYQELAGFWPRTQKYTENKDESLYVSFLKYYQAKGENLYFSFITNRGETYLARLNEQTGKVTVYKLTDPEEKYKQAVFFKITGGGLILAVNNIQNLEQNPGLYFITFDELE